MAHKMFMHKHTWVERLAQLVRVAPSQGLVIGSSPIFLTKNMEDILAEMYLYVPPGCKEFKVFICNKKRCCMPVVRQPT